MNVGSEVARGKTKTLYEAPDQPELLIVSQSDAISAGDGARRNEIAGKGRLAAQTTARVFRLLNLCGIPTHYVSGGEDDDKNQMFVRRCTMIPLEVVVRGVAAGSLVKRRPSLARGTPILPRMIEFFFKDDANHDPLIEPEEIVARGLASPVELSTMSEIARLTFEILAHAWRRHDTLLVDLKVEFGRLASGDGAGNLVIADVIDNDSWRIWPQGREELMLDKQMYRNLQSVGSEDLERVASAYQTVAQIVGGFPQLRPGMVALMCEGSSASQRAENLVQQLQALGLPSVRHVASARQAPALVLQLVAQLNATFPRLILVAVEEGNALRAVLEGSSASPVLAAGDSAEALALQCAKCFGLEDTVMFGRALLMQANARAAIIQADANLNPNPEQLA